MKKTICNRIYDTETAAVIKQCTYSYFGDPNGYEETLYQTQDGFYFIYTNGGEASPYITEDIKRIGKAKVNHWLEAHS